MVDIPAYCHRCDFAFQNTGIAVEPSSNVKITNSFATCPNCGFKAKLLEGTFDVSPDGRIHMKSGIPPLTRRMLQQFDLLTREAIRQEISLPEYALRASKIHPKLPEVVSKAATKVAQQTKKHAKTVTVGALILALIAQCSARIEITLDVNQLIDQLQTVESGSNIQQDEPSREANTSTESPADKSP